MRKVLVLIAILAAAAACGGSSAFSSANHSSVGGAPAQLAPGKGATAPGSSDFGPNQPAPVPVQGPQVIKQAQLTLTVKSGTFDSSLAAVRGLVEGEQGFIAGTDAQANPETNDQIRSGVISFMVPEGNFDATIDALNNLGKVQSEHITGQDVSAQYVDLKARLANEEAQRDAMLALLAQAHSINDIITVQNQLGQITQQIEQLKGQIQYFDHNTAYSTIAVTIVEAGAPVQSTSTDSWGFATALSDAAHNFVTTVNYVISGLGAIGPVVIVLWLGYLVWRRRGSPGLKRA
ncbi:MAG TPA: DUF4349 domain-containing protein [Candidatus Dormibacteraeota bacterium]|nr:DUF4349 domain-containing protein [Candidatus Dormibacteraeota bacterium]